MPTPIELQQKFKKLPENLRDAIFSVDTANIIQAISKKYGLAVDKMGELADEVGLLMLGITHPKDFVANLGSRLGTDAETTQKIAQELNAQIFSKVKESLKKLHGVGEEALESREQNLESRMPLTSTPPPTPAPEIKKVGEFKSLKSSPFEEKLKDKVFPPEAGQPRADKLIQKEVEEARKEQRYPGGVDPYKELPDEK